MSPRNDVYKSFSVSQATTNNETGSLKKTMIDFYQNIKDDDLKFLLEKTMDDVIFSLVLD